MPPAPFAGMRFLENAAEMEDRGLIHDRGAAGGAHTALDTDSLRRAHTPVALRRTSVNDAMRRAVEARRETKTS